MSGIEFSSTGPAAAEKASQSAEKPATGATAQAAQQRPEQVIDGQLSQLLGDRGEETRPVGLAGYQHARQVISDTLKGPRHHIVKLLRLRSPLDLHLGQPDF